MTSLATLNELFPSRTEETARATNSVEDLGSDEFLQLMVAQLENQDPTKPIDNSEFVAQLAQFGTVTGVQELNEGFADLAASLNSSQGWQAASLVGSSVATESNLGQLRAVEGEADTLSLTATVDFQGSTTGGALYVQDLTGRLVYTAPLPPGVGGELQIQWDGLDLDGNPLPEGSYRISAETQVNGSSTALPVYAHQEVVSVAINSTTGEATLNLSDGQSVPVSGIRQFL